MTVVKICGAALTAAVIAAIVRRIDPDISRAVIAVSAIVIASSTFTQIAPTIGFLSSLSGGEDYPEYLKLMLKGAGIAIICGSVSDICIECGESSRSGKIELAGKIELIALSLPLIKHLISTATEILG